MTKANILKAEKEVMISYPQIGPANAGMAEYARLAINDLISSKVKKISLVGAFLDLDQKEEIEQITIRQQTKLKWTVLMSLAILSRGFLFSYPFRPFVKAALAARCIYVPHSFFGVSVFLGALLKALPGRKIVWTLHDPVRHEERKSRLFLFLKRLEYKQILRLCTTYKNRLFIHIHAQKLITNTPWQGLENMVCWPHPVPKALVRNPNYESKIVIGFFGRIEPYKGLELLLRSIASVQEHFSKEVKILIMGKGTFDHGLLKHLTCELEIHNYFIQKQMLHEGIARMDCVVLPYISATQSGVGYLGISYNKPIIATNVGALSDVIEQSANRYSMLCDTTEKSLGNALLKFVNNYVREQN